MIIDINDSVTTGEISHAFAGAFPFLGIAFFKDSHQWGAASAYDKKIAPEKVISEIRTTRLPGTMEIHGWHKTGAVEQAFRDLFGLYVQIYRREGKTWVQTTDTDQRTLEEQNEAAANASQELMDGTDVRFNDEQA